VKWNEWTGLFSGPGKIPENFEKNIQEKLSEIFLKKIQKKM
jgi:hypothetical protein